MGDAVRCPYCGAEMKIEWWHADSKSGGTSGNYFACKCGARSPQRATEVTAYEAAMQRYVETNRVLTFDELLSLDGEQEIWFEWRNWNMQLITRDWLSTEDEPVARQNYGKTARAWLRRPTDKEREAVAWLT